MAPAFRLIQDHEAEIREARIGQLLNVDLPQSDDLRWLDLDIDLEVESIEHPERYPLVSKVRTGVVREKLGARVRKRGARI